MSTRTLEPVKRRPRVRVGERVTIYLDRDLERLGRALAEELGCSFSYALSRLIHFLLASYSHSPDTLARAIEEHEARQGAGPRS